jgi:hypothetical protein
MAAVLKFKLAVSVVSLNTCGGARRGVICYLLKSLGFEKLVFIRFLFEMLHNYNLKYK